MTASAELGFDEASPLPGDDFHVALERAVADAREAWPEIGDVPGFDRFVTERVEDADDPCAALEQLHLDDLYVAHGCAHGNAGAVGVFDAHVMTAVPRAVARIDGSPAFTEEIAQRTRLRLLVSEAGERPRIAGYRGRGKLRSWVQVTAVRLALEERRRKNPAEANRSDRALENARELSGDPEIEHIRMMYRDDFSTAFKEALGTLSARERNVLRLYLLDGLNIDQIGAIYRVHRATIARWIAKARESLLKEARKRVRERLQISAGEFESLMGMVRSHLDLSLDRFLNDAKT